MNAHPAHLLKKLSAAFLLLAVYAVATLATPMPDKMTPEEVVAKHLAAIGPADALASIKSLVIVGNARAITRTNAVRELTGLSQLASEGDKVLLAMIFNSTAYPYEKASYNGHNFMAALLPGGKRSILGNFLATNQAVFKQGLIGGVLSTAWPLLNLSAKNVKLSYSGTEKINGRPAHKLKYDSRKTGGLQVNLFFDAETFQHVRTEYQYAISARMGATAEESISQTGSHYKLVEDFSDYQMEGKLMLPHTYKIKYELQEQNTQVFEWVLALSKFAFNEVVEAKAFDITTN